MNNKIYFFVTLACVLTFAGFYRSFDNGYEARIEAVKKQADEEHRIAAAKDAETRSKAVKDAVAAADRRKQEQAAMERQEEAQKVARQEAEDSRAKAFDERRRFREQADRLRKEVDLVAADVTKAAEQKKQLEQEKAFLVEAVTQARANVRSFQGLLDKLESAEKATAVATPTRTAKN